MGPAAVGCIPTDRRWRSSAAALLEDGLISQVSAYCSPRIRAAEMDCVCASVSDCAWARRRQPAVSVAPPFLPRTILRRMFGVAPHGSHNGCNGGPARRVARRCTDDCSRILQDTTVPPGSHNPSANLWHAWNAWPLIAGRLHPDLPPCYHGARHERAVGLRGSRLLGVWKLGVCASL